MYCFGHWNTIFEENRDPLCTPPQSFPNPLSTTLQWADHPRGGCSRPAPRLGGPTQGPERPPPTAAVPFLQVKELGAVIYNCSRLARDLEKTFQTYWVLGAPKAVLPKHWPRHFSSHFNRFQPLWARFAGVPTTAYFSVSGLEQCPALLAGHILLHLGLLCRHHSTAGSSGT